jgi:hypothetical protein
MMAVTLNARTISKDEPRSTFTMSLIHGWNLIGSPARGGRSLIAGDLILLEVRKPAPPVAGPPGWTALGEFTWTDNDGTEHQGSAFWKIIGPAWTETPPTFTAEGTADWEVLGHAVTGYAAAGDGVTGSAVPSPPS